MSLRRRLGLRRPRPVRPPGETMATLVLRRPGPRWRALGGAWEVELDGMRLARLRSGGERRLDVAPGAHRLNLWAGDVGSLPLRLTLMRGEVAVIEAMTMARAVGLGLVEPGFAPDPLLLRRIA